MGRSTTVAIIPLLAVVVGFGPTPMATGADHHRSRDPLYVLADIPRIPGIWCYLAGHGPSGTSIRNCQGEISIVDRSGSVTPLATSNAATTVDLTPVSTFELGRSDAMVTVAHCRDTSPKVPTTSYLCAVRWTDPATFTVLEIRPAAHVEPVSVNRHGDVVIRSMTHQNPDEAASSAVVWWANGTVDTVAALTDGRSVYPVTVTDGGNIYGCEYSLPSVSPSTSVGTHAQRGNSSQVTMTDMKPLRWSSTGTVHPLPLAPNSTGTCVTAVSNNGKRLEGIAQDSTHHWPVRWQNQTDPPAVAQELLDISTNMRVRWVDAYGNYLAQDTTEEPDGTYRSARLSRGGKVHDLKAVTIPSPVFSLRYTIPQAISIDQFGTMYGKMIDPLTGDTIRALFTKLS